MKGVRSISAAAGLLVVLLTMACNGNNSRKWKQPVSVDFVLEMTHTDLLNGKLRFDNGTINVRSFGFEGTREQGADVVFAHSYAGLTVDMDGQATSALSFDIPQGNYIWAKVTLDATAVDGNTVSLSGTYSSSDGNDYPVTLYVDADEIFAVYATDAVGDKNFVLEKDHPATGRILFDISYWFANVTDLEMDDAELGVDGGHPAIILSTEENTELFDDIDARITQGISMTIN